MHQNTKNYIIAGCIGLAFAAGCKRTTDYAGKPARPAIPVTVAAARIGPMVTYLELSATSEFLLKSIIKSPVTGYVESIKINTGDAVKKNLLLFTIRTKESAAIRDDSLSSLNFRGVVSVKAPDDGLILNIDHPGGDFVSEGDQLCRLAIPGSLVFVLDVPFELSAYVNLNMPCEIVLPDKRVIKGIVRSRLPLMSGSSQTERFIITLPESENLPENLSGLIRIVKESLKGGISLSKSCILTNETMDNYWVMKLINDSMAVKVPVITGINQDDYVQITDPEFKSTDVFLSSGNYGLGDTAFVKVLKNENPKSVTRDP